MGQNFWDVVAETGRAAGAGYGGLLERKQALTEQERQERIRQGEFLRSLIFQKRSELQNRVVNLDQAALGTVEGQWAQQELNDLSTLLATPLEELMGVWDKRYNRPPQEVFGPQPDPAVPRPEPAFTVAPPPFETVLAGAARLERGAKQRRTQQEEARNMLVQIAHNAQGVYTPEHQALANAALRDPNADFVKVLSGIAPIAVTVLETRAELAAVQGELRELPADNPVRIRLEEGLAGLEPVLAKEAWTSQELASVRQAISGTRAEIGQAVKEVDVGRAGLMRQSSVIEQEMRDGRLTREQAALFFEAVEARNFELANRLYIELLDKRGTKAAHERSSAAIIDLLGDFRRLGITVPGVTLEDITTAIRNEDPVAAAVIANNLMAAAIDGKERKEILRGMIGVISDNNDVAEATRTEALAAIRSNDLATMDEFMTRAGPQLTAAFQRSAERVALHDQLARHGVRMADIELRLAQFDLQEAQLVPIARAAANGGVAGLDAALDMADLGAPQREAARQMFLRVAERRDDEDIEIGANRLNAAIDRGDVDRVRMLGGTTEQVTTALNNQAAQLSESIVRATTAKITAEQINSMMRLETANLFKEFGRAGLDLTDQMKTMRGYDESLGTLYDTYRVIGEFERAAPQEQRAFNQVIATAKYRPPEARWPESQVELKRLLQEAGFKRDNAKLVAEGIVDGWRRDASAEALEMYLRQAQLASMSQRVATGAAAAPEVDINRLNTLSLNINRDRAIVQEEINNYTDKCLIVGGTTPTAPGVPQPPAGAGPFGHLSEPDRQWCETNQQGHRRNEQLLSQLNQDAGEVLGIMQMALGFEPTGGIAIMDTAAQAEAGRRLKEATAAENVIIAGYELEWGNKGDSLLTPRFSELLSREQDGTATPEQLLELTALTTILGGRGYDTRLESLAFFQERNVLPRTDQDPTKITDVYFRNELRGAVGRHVGEGIYNVHTNLAMRIFHQGMPKRFQGDLTDPAQRQLLLDTTNINDPGFTNQFNYVTVVQTPFGFALRGVKGPIQPGPVMFGIPGEPTLGRDASAQVAFYDTQGRRITDQTTLTRLIAAQQ